VVDGMLRVRVAAGPVDGAANTALIRVLADALGRPPSSIRITAGATSRRKIVQVDGLEPETLRSRWPGLDV
jgi:uncharacterized protein YggU (UPF0235/DUF167 family)